MITPRQGLILAILTAAIAAIRARPKQWLAIVLLAALAMLGLILCPACSTSTSLEPDGTGGWNASTDIHVSGSKAVLPARQPKPATSQPAP